MPPQCRAKNFLRWLGVAGLGRDRYRVEIAAKLESLEDAVDAVVEIGNHAQRQSVLAQPCEHRFRCGVANPIRRVGEEGEQRVEVGLELREMTDIRERCSHQLTPPFAFQSAQLCGLVAWTEGESRRSAERAPEGID